MKKQYKIKKNTEGEFHDRGSKFLATLVKISSEKEAAELMDQMRKAHPKANHLCYAYRLQKNNILIENLSDDGEPTHSAGQPILRQLQAEDLINTLAMVIRYFGGVKLGVGGLMKAYKNATQEAIKVAEKAEVQEMEDIHILVNYSLYGEVLAILDREDLEFIIENKHEEAVIELRVLKERAEEIKGLFAALSIQFI